MYRSWGLQTLTGSAQYLFQDKLTADMAVPLEGVDPIIHVADTTKYQDGDLITLDPGQTDADTVLVTTILSSTTMRVTSQGAVLHAHANNTVICLDLVCGQIIIQCEAVKIYIGSDNTVTNTGGGSAFIGLPAAAIYTFGAAQWNPLRTTDVLVAGVMNDLVGVAAYVV